MTGADLAALGLRPSVCEAACRALTEGRSAAVVQLEHNLTGDQLRYVCGLAGEPLPLFPRAQQLDLFGGDAA